MRQINSKQIMVNRGVLSVFLVLLLLIGVVRIGYITIFRGQELRTEAEDNAYTETVIKAKRGSIYDSNGDYLASSYSVWDFSIDPNYLHTALMNDISAVKYNNANGTSFSKDNNNLKSFKEDISQKYIEAVANVIVSILEKDNTSKKYKNPTAEKLIEDINNVIGIDKNGDNVYKSYVVIRKEINGVQKRKIENALSNCYYNYSLDKFYVASKKADDEFGDAKIAYFYDPVTEEESSVEGISASHLNCICREGVAFTYTEKQYRTYRNDEICSSILGFATENGATGGIEAYYNDTLSGTNGLVSGLAISGSGTMASSSKVTTSEVKDGYNLYLTINSNIQNILEDNLKALYKQYTPEETFGIVMDVNTGAVIAMSNYPNYQLSNPSLITEEETALDKARLQIVFDNKIKGIVDEEGNPLEPEEDETKERALNNQWSNFCVSYPYEVGSTFKIFTASAALEENVSVSSSKIFDCTGLYHLVDRDIGCAGHIHYGVDMRRAIVQSCNGFFIELGTKLGVTTFNKYFKAFGFNEKTGIDTYGEEVGSNKSTPAMTKVELGSTAYGQTATITPIQLITAASAIANGGELLKPYLVDKIVDNNGNIISKTEKTVRRRVLSEDVCKTVSEMMTGVVHESGGTAHGVLNVKGYTICGKTGSGEIQRGSTMEKDEKLNRYTGSFLGFAPAEDPQIAILIGIRRNPEIKGAENNYIAGGNLTGPYAGTVLSYALNELKIQSPTGNSNDGTCPDVEEMPVLSAKATLSSNGYTAIIYGEGDSVVYQIPEPGNQMPESGVVALFTEEDYELVKVPNMIGLTKTEALQVARANGINIRSNDFNTDSDVITYQEYSDEAEVYPGSTIDVYFSDASEYEPPTEENEEGLTDENEQAETDENGQAETDENGDTETSEDESSTIGTETTEYTQSTTGESSYQSTFSE